MLACMHGRSGAFILYAAGILLFCESSWAEPSQARKVPDQQPPQPVVYYLDGSGGGGLIMNWGRKVERGLRQGGFRGDFEQYDWQTGMGPLLDHHMSESSKRKEARKLAARIKAQMDKQPNRTVHLVGLSAGTAVLVFTLEALPQGYQVENAVLMGSSLGADYDLTRALRRVRNRMYVLTSKNDPVLRSLVPLLGTADRNFGLSGAAGVKGFKPPSGASDDARRLYAKVVHVPWRPEFARYGHLGSHTGATTPDFVARYLTPIVKVKKPDTIAASRPAGEPPRSAGR